VSIPGPSGKLDGALFLPDGRGPHPGIVLLHDTSLPGRHDYAQEARFFATNGVAALTYDKRGTGGSAGDANLSNFGFLAHDAMAAAKFLRGTPGIDSTRVGVWGRGEGGWIAPMAAAADSSIAFVLLVSAPAVSPLQQLEYQRAEELAAGGVARGDAEAIARLRGRIWEFWLAPSGSGTSASDSLRGAFEKARKRPWFARAVERGDLPEELVPDEAMGSENHPARAWLPDDMSVFWSLGHDPAWALERVTAPVLALYGEKDRVVPASRSVAALRAAVWRSPVKRRRAVAHTFPDADHAMLVRRGSGLFARLDFAAGYRDSVSSWLRRVVGTPR
jgi:dienelactone hydrolase